jgi:tetratricopeptide (TPR) repeat protein
MKRALLTTLFAIIFGSLSTVCSLYAQDAGAWADFQQKAAAWRALPVKPAISEEVRLERVQAENAFREKRLADAAGHYESGLKIDPVWPEGYFNAALIEAELEDYDKAIWHMRAYVELVPDATDAREARDQIAIWQDKLKLKLKLEEAVTWTDPATGLMWTKKDNGTDMNWQQATDYCRNLQLAGHGDWRLPTIEELQGIYDNKVKVGRYHLKGNLQMSGSGEWSSTLDNDFGKALRLDSVGMGRGPGRLGGSYGGHALCVRRPGE